VLVRAKRQRRAESPRGSRNPALSQERMADDERRKPPTTSTQGRLFYRLGDGVLEPAVVGVGAQGLSTMDADQSGMRIFAWGVGGTYPKSGWTKSKILKLPATVKISDKVTINYQYIAIDPSSMCPTIYVRSTATVSLICFSSFRSYR
jgi:hypothetical protein